MTELNEGQQLLGYVVDCSHHLVGGLKPSGRGQVNMEIASLRQAWDKLSDDISATSTSLEERLLLWTQYNHHSSSFRSWIEEVEESVQQVVEPKMEISDKKAQLHKVKVSGFNVN